MVIFYSKLLVCSKHENQHLREAATTFAGKKNEQVCEWRDVNGATVACSVLLGSSGLVAKQINFKKIYALAQQWETKQIPFNTMKSHQIPFNPMKSH